jgi:hypothetical protein
MQENIISELCKKIPLETRLTVSNEMAMIDLLTELGFRDDKMWTKEEDPMLEKLCNLAKKWTKIQLDEIKEWEENGKPE